MKNIIIVILFIMVAFNLFAITKFSLRDINNDEEKINYLFIDSLDTEESFKKIDLQKLKKLENLVFNYSRIKAIPKSIIINNKKLTSISIVGAGELDLSFFKLLGNHKNITEIEIVDVNTSKIMNDIYNITSLEILKLHNNGIKKIDKRIAKLKNLKQLEFFRNKIDFITSEVFKLARLEFLAINITKKCKIKLNNTGLVNLRELDIIGFNDEYPYKNYSDVFKLKKIKYLLLMRMNL